MNTTPNAQSDLNSDPEKRYSGPVRKDWIQSLEGRQVFPRDLKPEQVGSIEEIAHALAGKIRFTGQTHQRYSVAEHCVRGSHLLPPAFAGAFLLHELSEVYLPDIAGPLKPFVFVDVEGGGLRESGGLISWSELEKRHTHAMLEALDLLSIESLIYSPEVKHLDWAMLAAEKRDLMGDEPADWHLPHPPAADEIRPWSLEAAASAFVSRFHDLFGNNYGAAHTPREINGTSTAGVTAPSDSIPF